MQNIMEAFEQNLLTLFESCDDYYQGTLNATGLSQLCNKLRLQESYHILEEYLLDDTKSNRINFQDFKEGLLKLLHESGTDDKSHRKILSAGRGTSQNKTYDEKKPERKLKLEFSEIYRFFSEDSSKSQNQSLSCITNDITSEESVPKKRKIRKPNKRKNSLNCVVEGSSNSAPDNQESSSLKHTMNEVEHLVTAWSNISQGITDSLSKEELVQVFQCVGLDRDSEEAAHCVFEKLGFEETGRITLQELLEFIKTGGSFNKEVRNQQMELETNQKNVSLEFFEPPSFGCVSGAYLVERWECEGVPGALQLLQNLGYTLSQQIDISSLVSVLSEEIKGLNDEFKSAKRELDPHIALLRANSVLQSLYIQSLKTAMEHLNAEKEKLRNDVIEANQRALFLAQEVDDHHSKLEHSTQQQVKVLEQKHAEKIREITHQSKSEQDALMAQNAALEKKLKTLEDEESKNKAIMSQLEMESRLLEQEHRMVVDQLTTLQQTKEKLERDLKNMPQLEQKVSEMEATLGDTDVMSLLERIQALELENIHLRDRNDELSVEVEELSEKLLNSSTKKRTNVSNQVPIDQSADESIVGGAVKRRGDSFLFVDSAEDSGGEEDSLRLEKVRKFSHVKDFMETTSSFQELQIHGCGSRDCKKDSCYNHLKFIDHEDVSECKNVNSYEIVPFSKELEQVDSMSCAMPSFQDDWSDDVKEKFKNIYHKLRKHDLALADIVMSTLKEVLSEKNTKQIKDSEESLKNRCKELEASLELLKEEYEKTEDYWAEKLEEERGFFEEEQKLSDKKYSELLEKIFEYEEMLNAEKEQRQRLETIEEKDSFEKQVTDMEQECAELKFKLSEALKEKDSETEKLKSEIERLKHSRDYVDCGVQVESNVTESLNLARESGKFPENNASRVQDLTGQSLECKKCGDFKNFLQMKMQFQIELDFMKEEQARLLKQISEHKQKLTSYGESDRVNELEQNCHTLMITLRQQQKQTEDILKNTWKQHKAEVKDLKFVLRMTEEKLKLQTKVIQDQLAKLTKTDLLVKDLFVENAYLISSVQKLEKQYQSICASNSKTSL